MFSELEFCKQSVVRCQSASVKKLTTATIPGLLIAMLGPMAAAMVGKRLLHSPAGMAVCRNCADRSRFSARFAPYIGIVWTGKLGGIADSALAAGENTKRNTTVAGDAFVVLDIASPVDFWLVAIDHYALREQEMVSFA